MKLSENATRTLDQTQKTRDASRIGPRIEKSQTRSPGNRRADSPEYNPGSTIMRGFYLEQR
jgi:hypothetical protein